MVYHQQGMANPAAHQAAHDAVAYHVLMGESAAHSSMPPNVSNEHSLVSPGLRWWLLFSGSESTRWVFTL